MTNNRTTPDREVVEREARELLLMPDYSQKAHQDMIIRLLAALANSDLEIAIQGQRAGRGEGSEADLSDLKVGGQRQFAGVPAGCRPEVVAFANLMEQQLRANDHKPGWKSDGRWTLFHRMVQEVRETGDVLDHHDGGIGDALTIGREAADVANFAMMIADVCGALTPPMRTIEHPKNITGNLGGSIMLIDGKEWKLVPVEALDELLTYADLMPKRTPAAGSCATEHQFTISAGAIWGLDQKVAEMRAALLSTAPKPEGGADWGSERKAFMLGWEACTNHIETGWSGEQLKRQAEIACDDVPVLMTKRANIPRCAKCGAGPVGNCGYYGCETPRETCPLAPAISNDQPTTPTQGVEELRAALVTLRDLPIIENDSPNTLHLDGQAFTGPVVDWTFSIVRKVKEIASAALARSDLEIAIRGQHRGAR